MKKILFLVSGNGGLLRFITACINKGILPGYEICAVIADRTCAAYDFAKNRGFECRIVKYNASKREELLTVMKRYNFDVGITNIYKILDLEIVNTFNGKLINVHPSLLPAFGGVLHAVNDAIAYGVKFVGTTVHYVNEAVDAGEIIAQSVMPVIKEETLDAIIDQQFRAWSLNLLNVLLRVSDNRLTDHAKVYQSSMFNPPLCFNTVCFDEDFWNKVRSEVL